MPISACERLASACERIAATEDDLRAWAYLDESGARDALEHLDPNAPLAGAILGVKDIFDVAGMPTRCGIAELPDRSSGADATAVARLRDAGAIVLGKTHTTPFAWLDPAPTRNPYDRDRTPGGSSAGSAAAVAAGHCTIALGSQTVASTLRPASFCGIVGFKPSFGRIPTAGITPLAPSLDHVGIFARTISEVRATTRVLDPSPERVGTARTMPVFLVDERANDPAAEAGARAALARAVAALRAMGATVHSASLPDAVRRGSELVSTLLGYESFAVHGELWRSLGAALPSHLRDLVTNGSAISRTVYEDALAERESLRPAIAACFADGSILVTLCALGEAPDRASTGDGRYIRPWTFFGVPSIAIPVSSGPSGLPIGVQLVAEFGHDAELLDAAAFLAEALRDDR